MENSVKELERELENLNPQAPSAALMDRLERELESAPVRTARPARSRYTTATSWSSWKWANWTVAAALVALLAISSTLEDSVMSDQSRIASLATATGVDSADVLRPVRAGRTLIESRPEAVIELPDGSPVERVRDYFVDTIEWQNAAGEAQLRWEVPREAVRFVALASY